MTFGEFYSWLQTAKRDHVGMHQVGKYAAVHIYEGKRECNLCWNDEPVMKVRFDYSSNTPAEVEALVYNVVNGIVDYDRAVHIPLTESMMFATRCCTKMTAAKSIITALNDNKEV